MCSGSKNAVVPVEGGKRQVALAAIESPKNWFEDFGSAQLVAGLATVQLDATFRQTVNANLEYHVFLTPNGDCKGLYVHQKTATSFEVRELGGGNSHVTAASFLASPLCGRITRRFALPIILGKRHQRDGRVRPATK